MKVLLIGGGGREHAIAETLVDSGAELYAAMKHKNPGIKRISKDVLISNETDIEKICVYAKMKGIEMAVVGPEAPLEAGIVNALEEEGVICASPTKEAARIETSKAFMRELMRKYNIPGIVEFRIFSNVEEVKEFIYAHPKEVVVKPVGLTGGKGVKIVGEQLLSKEDVVNYAHEIIENRIGGEPKVIIEDKMVGEEFTLQAFTDGKKVYPMPLVQDHKRAFENDEGPNTGGMGSYSQEDHLLPFMSPNERDEGIKILQKIIDAMREEGAPFKGVIYGQFMLTKYGSKVIEINSRFGDPEAMNVLPLLKTSLMQICEEMAEGNLRTKPEFENLATVCKYVVPPGYGIKPEANVPIEVDEDGIKSTGSKLYYASVNEGVGNVVYTTTSRALSVVGYDINIEEAEKSAEAALKYISGNVYVRHDIGKKEALKRKIERMKKIRDGRL